MNANQIAIPHHSEFGQSLDAANTGADFQVRVATYTAQNNIALEGGFWHQRCQPACSPHMQLSSYQRHRSARCLSSPEISNHRLISEPIRICCWKEASATRH